MAGLAERTRGEGAVERLFEAAQRAIKQYILDHRLGADDPLPTEGQLVEELGISRNSVREAVKALEALGMVETRPDVPPGDAVRAWELHRGIVEALERRDGPAARRAMLANFGSLEQRLRQALQAHAGEHSTE